MVLHNAADSLADLMQVKDEREKQHLLQKPPAASALGGLGAAKDSVSDMMTISKQRSFRKQRESGCEYELEVDEEDDAPIWEMDMSNPWSGEDTQTKCNCGQKSSKFSLMPSVSKLFTWVRRQ